jgi:hypothetical protein
MPITEKELKMFGKSGRRYIVAGKIFVIETSNGNVVTQFESDDNPVVVCLNAYIKK